MERDELILAKDCCTTYNLEYSFITWLSDHELLEIENIEEQDYIPYYQLKDLEQYIRLHYELDINLEGIQAISHILHRVQQMQDEIILLKNKLRVYEIDKDFLEEY